MQKVNTTKKDPQVSIIVVTLDVTKLLHKSLLSIFNQTYKNIEIIVVCNGLEESLSEKLRYNYPDIKLIKLKKNYGFAGGNNAGIKMANGEYIALLNDDAIADTVWIQSMVDVMESDSRVGAVGSIIRDGNSFSTLDSCGVSVGLDGMSRQLRRGTSVPVLSEPEKVLAVSGCACMFRSIALKETGMFDQRFFAYCEDTDLSLRLRQACWNILVAPGSYVSHFYSKTGGAYSLNKIFWVERNHLWVALKNFPIFLIPLIPIVTIWRYLIQLYAVIYGVGDIDSFIKEGGTLKVIYTIVKAYISAIKGVPSMLFQRIRFRPENRLSEFEMFKLIVKFKLSMYDIIVPDKG